MQEIRQKEIIIDNICKFCTLLIQPFPRGMWDKEIKELKIMETKLKNKFYRIHSRKGK